MKSTHDTRRLKRLLLVYGSHRMKLYLGECGYSVNRKRVQKLMQKLGLVGMPDAGKWKGLEAIGMVESERFVNGQTTLERRHYICTLTGVKPFAHAVRAHGRIENSLHWVLDVTFREDGLRIRKGYAPENFNIVRQIAINLLKMEAPKLSIKRKRFMSALSDKFREKVIFSL